MNAWRASWLITLGVRNDGTCLLGVLGNSSNIGSCGSSGTCVTLVGDLDLGGLSCSLCFSFASSLLAIRASLALTGCAPLSLGALSFLVLLFLALCVGISFLILFSPSEFCSPSEIWPPSEFTGGVLLGGMMPGVLFLVVRWWTLGAALMLAGFVGVVDVGVTDWCLLSRFVVAVPKMSASFSNACICLPAWIDGCLSIPLMVLVKSCAIATALSMGVSLGTPACCGYSLYCADVLVPPVLVM